MSSSIVMSVYHKENPTYLKECLDSIDNQVIKPCEIVLVKDGSLTSELDVVIGSYKERLPIKIIELEQNVGLGAALNVGIRNSSYDFIVRMDTDDRMKPNRVATLLKFMHDNPEIGVCGSSAVVINERGVESGVRKNPIFHDQILANLWANPLIHPSVIMRKSVIESAGLYDPLLRRRQDYELWFRLAKNGVRFANISEPLIDYRFSNITFQKQSIKLALEQAMIGYRGSKLLNLKYTHRLLCFYPFLRSLLPVKVQALTVRLLENFDPRSRS